MGGPPRVAAFGLRRPADSDFDAEYAERTQTCQAETEALCDKIDYHHEPNDKEKTKAIKDDTEKLNAQLDATAINAPGAERADRGAGSDGKA